MIDRPLVSILIPAYNAEQFLSETIESVLNTNYTNWELIIVNDKSTDRTIEIANSYCLKDARIKVFSNPQNLGDYPNRNKTASYAQGKYLKYIDHDDILYKYSLDYMVEAMEKFRDAGLGIGFIVVDDKKPYPIFCSSKETYRAEYIEKGFLAYGPSAAIIRRDVFEEVGGFSGSPFLGDHELWLKIALKFPIVKLQPSLIWYRTHINQESNNEKKNIRNMVYRYKLAYDSLLIAKNLFNTDEFKLAKKRIKRNYSRSILRNMIIKGKLIDSIYLYKKSNLNLFELLDGFRKYL